MASLCGGCPFCQEGMTTTLITTSAPPSTEAPAPPPAGACESWCESDFTGGNNQGRHCAPGDMANLCGGCSFCNEDTNSTSTACLCAFDIDRTLTGKQDR